MTPFIVGLVAFSAVLHLAWNVRLKRAGDLLRAATIGMLAASVGIVPAGIVAWWLGGRVALAPEGVVLGLVSGVIEAAYFILLAAAYRRGDLSVVYPLARGTAPHGPAQRARLAAGTRRPAQRAPRRRPAQRSVARRVPPRVGCPRASGAPSRSAVPYEHHS